MRARDLVEPFPTVNLDTDALQAARTIGIHGLPGLIICDDDGSPYSVLPGSEVLRFLVPRYVQDDPALAGAYDEKSSDELCGKTLDPGGADPPVTTTLVLVVSAAAYVLIATERVDRVAAALGGAGAMVLLGVVDFRVAFFSEKTGVDWNVIFLLLGMMIIVSVLKQAGIFDYLAIWAAQRACGRPFAVMVMLVIITAAASALLDNVTTVLLVAPVTLLV